MILGDLGAEVIKVERPGTGDETRQWQPPFAGSETAYYLCCNRNKKSLTLNLKHERGVEIARTLAENSDVLIENFRIGGASELGLGYDELRQVNPRLIYCSISGFGHTGPDRELPGYDLMIQARGGIMSITGERDGTPTKIGVAVSDVATALFASNAILAALFVRERTGEGQHLDIALLDSQIALLANIGSNYLCSGEVPQRWGNAHSGIVPYQAFKAAGADRLGDDERFATNSRRVANRDDLIPSLENLFQQRTVAEWLQLCGEADVPAGPVNTLDEVFADPQTRARDMLVEMPHPTANTMRLAGSPLNLSATPVQMRLPPPLLGEHTDEILANVLGFDETTIANLRRVGAV